MTNHDLEAAALEIEAAVDDWEMEFQQSFYRAEREAARLLSYFQDVQQPNDDAGVRQRAATFFRRLVSDEI